MQEFIQTLRDGKVKATPQRQLILKEFLALKRHVSAEEMCALVHRKDPSIGQATVFRFMKTLVDAGIAQASGLGERGTRYEPGRTYHGHMICTACGAVAEFKSPVIEKAQKAVAARLGYFLTNHRMELYGLCSRCVASKKNVRKNAMSKKEKAS